MSSERPGTMPIRIDEHVYDWINVLKDALGTPTISATIEKVIRDQYKDIEAVTAEAHEKEGERMEIVKRLVT